MKHKLTVTLLLALCVPIASATTWYVHGVSGSDSDNCMSSTTACKTIKHAISLAGSGDSIVVAAATYTENLTIGKNLKLIGSSASTTIIDGGGLNTVVTISSASAHVNLSKLTIRNGVAVRSGGGIFSVGILTISNSTLTGNKAINPKVHFGSLSITGGGIQNFGTIIIKNSTLSGNSADCSGSGCGRAAGGGIGNAGTMTISTSTLSGNVADTVCTGCGAFGGGIDNAGTLMISNSTLSANVAEYKCGLVGFCTAKGGGISNGGTLTINNSTISGNFDDGFPGVGGIFNGRTATLRNSIVANNSVVNCSGTLSSKGYNLSSDGSCTFNGPGDMNNINPMLGPLQNNGGPTQTMALLPGSPAIDAGNPNGCTDSNDNLLKTDQRGMPRTDPEDTGGCDMGAYERQSD